MRDFLEVLWSIFKSVSKWTAIISLPLGILGLVAGDFESSGLTVPEFFGYWVAAVAGISVAVSLVLGYIVLGLGLLADFGAAMTRPMREAARSELRAEIEMAHREAHRAAGGRRRAGQAPRRWKIVEDDGQPKLFVDEEFLEANPEFPELFRRELNKQGAAAEAQEAAAALRERRGAGTRR